MVHVCVMPATYMYNTCIYMYVRDGFKTGSPLYINHAQSIRLYIRLVAPARQLRASFYSENIIILTLATNGSNVLASGPSSTEPGHRK